MHWFSKLSNTPFLLGSIHDALLEIKLSNIQSFSSTQHSKESRRTRITQTQIPETPIILNSSHLRIMIISRIISCPLRWYRNCITQEHRKYLVVARVAFWFIECCFKFVDSGILVWGAGVMVTYWRGLKCRSWSSSCWGEGWGMIVSMSPLLSLKCRDHHLLKLGQWGAFHLQSRKLTHVWGNKHPLRELVIRQVLIKHREVLDLSKPISIRSHRVVTHKRTIISAH